MIWGWTTKTPVLSESFAFLVSRISLCALEGRGSGFCGIATSHNTQAYRIAPRYLLQRSKKTVYTILLVGKITLWG